MSESDARVARLSGTKQELLARWLAEDAPTATRRRPRPVPGPSGPSPRSGGRCWSWTNSTSTTTTSPWAATRCTRS
ncbi:hypothetical protein NKH77_07610 [Streptomyces sp. M19]